ncbi:MAG: hypothetical protein MI673_02680 [Thiotrichales bacterium]|nr:hypothetical protein [Thiotrichales bacterium]
MPLHLEIYPSVPGLPVIFHEYIAYFRDYSSSAAPGSSSGESGCGGGGR